MTKKDLQEHWLYVITKNANGDQRDQYYVFYDEDIYEYRLLDLEFNHQTMDIVEAINHYDSNIWVLDAKLIDEFWDEENSGHIYIVYAVILTEISEVKTATKTELKKSLIIPVSWIIQLNSTYLQILINLNNNFWKLLMSWTSIFSSIFFNVARAFSLWAIVIMISMPIFIFSIKKAF